MYFVYIIFSDEVDDHVFEVKDKRVFKQWVNPKIGTIRLLNKWP